MHELAFLLQNHVDMAMAHRIAGIILIAIPIIIAVFYAIIITPCWFICKKAGFSPWLSLINLLPFGAIILLYVLAFADWNVVPVAQAFLQPLPPYPPQPPLPPVAPQS